MSEREHWKRRAEIAERREVELDREADRLREALRELREATEDYLRSGAGLDRLRLGDTPDE
jgi:predicted  nucleic acid-binding Zn-ribbon protein